MEKILTPQNDTSCSNHHCNGSYLQQIEGEDQKQQLQQQQQRESQQNRRRRPGATFGAYPALDGGWGYLVAVGAFCVAFMLDGTENSYGLLLPHVISEFGGHVAVASMCGGLVTGVILGAGPLAAFLVRKFGCRRVSFAGSIVASASVVMATLARRIEVFILFYGLFAGFGMGLVYLPSVTMINAYFNRKRGLFAGVVTSGSGIGLLVLSLLIDLLINEYGWRGCYLIIGGILLNLCVCSSLMRPLADNYRSKSNAGINFPSKPVSDKSAVDEKVITKTKDVKIRDWVASQPLLPSEQTNGVVKSLSRLNDKSKTPPIPQFKSLQNLASENHESCEKGLGHVDIQDARKGEAKDFSTCDLFKIVRFDLFCVGAFLVQVTSIIPTMFVPSYVVSAGLSASTAATIVSFLGISNTAGRLSAGFLSYLGLGSVLIYNSGTFLAGLACFLLPFCSTFPSLVAFAVGHGFFIGFFPPLQSVILVEQLGLERLPSSFGIMCVCKSLASVSGPFFAGALYEWAQNYAVPFYLSGITMMVANIVHIIMSFCPRPDFMVN